MSSGYHTRRMPIVVRALAAATAASAAAALLVVPSSFGGNSKPAGGSSSCTRNPATVNVDNNYAWATPGSWGLARQQLTYAVHVMNNDVGCGSSSFAISVGAPAGFAVSVPTSTISLGSSASGYLWPRVTSPTVVGDGDYPVTVSVQRAGDAAPSGSGTNYFKVYSSDTAPPTLFWANPWQGQTINGNSLNVNVSSSDDHAVKSIDLSIDGKYVTTTSCDDVSYTCQLSYKWSHPSKGAHTATFTSYDWMGNAGSLAVGFTVG
jgi:hypothetical protein